MICTTCGNHYFKYYSEDTKECPNCIDVIPGNSWVDDFDETEVDCLVNGSSRKTKTYISDDDTESFSS